jgi:glutaredoxin 3
MITIYGNNSCIYCKKAKQLAIDHDLEYEWKSTDNQEILNDLKLKLPNVKTIPQIWIDNIHIGGYNDLLSHVLKSKEGKI